MNIALSDFNKNIYSIFILILIGILLLLFFSLSTWALIGALFSCYIFINLLHGFGEGIPVNLVMSFLACLQWVVGPILSYYTGLNHPFYKMHVPEETYFSYVIPGIFLFYLGLTLPILNTSYIIKQKLLELEEVTTHRTKGAYYLIGIGFASSLLSSFVPSFLLFLLYLFSQLKFVGGFYLYLSKSRNNLIIAIVFLTLLLEVLTTAIFHDLILWALFFLFIYCIKNYVNMRKKLAFVLAGFFFLLILQSVKYQYRDIAWADTSLSSLARTEVFSNMLLTSIQSPERLFDPDKSERTITRLNQGWIIARVINYVPYNQPFANGETIINAFKGALLPRFVAEDKATAGGRENMERFTGIDMQAGTSMNISLIGEGYANYGKNGGILFMLFIGILFSSIFNFVLNRSKENPTLILWIPFLFLQVIKAETDLVTTLNYLVKASIAMLIIFWIFKNILKLEL